MGFREEVQKHYMDEDGLVTVERDPSHWSTGNGLLHAGIFYTLLKLRGELNAGSDVVAFADAVDRCWYRGCFGPIAGLLNRNPGRPDQEARDDYIGVAVASYHLGTEHAGDICLFGEWHGWCFDNVNPFVQNFAAWHGRFPGLIGLYQLAADESPSWFQKLGLAAWIAVNALEQKRDTGEAIQTWLAVTVAKGKGWILDKAVAMWERRARKNFGTIGAMLEPYFGSGHPFASISTTF